MDEEEKKDVGSADDDFRSEAFRRLNERFYETSPAPYFEHRLNNLLVASAADETLGPQLRAGIEIAGDRISVGEHERIESDMAPDELTRFITAESLVLLSHAAEATIRLFLAHEGQPPCPWWEMSSLAFPDFWRKVSVRFIDPIHDSRLRPVVADVILGAPERYESFPHDEAAWSQAVDRLTRWLRHLAKVLVENRDTYNAAKHGFAAKPSNALLQFVDEASGDAIVQGEGPSLEALVHSNWINNERIWRLETVWLRPLEMWAGVNIACQIIEAIWSVGRATVSSVARRSNDTGVVQAW